MYKSVTWRIRQARTWSWPWSRLQSRPQNQSTTHLSPVLFRPHSHFQCPLWWLDNKYFIFCAQNFDIPRYGNRYMWLQSFLLPNVARAGIRARALRFSNIVNYYHRQLQYEKTMYVFLQASVLKEKTYYKFLATKSIEI